MASVQGGDLDRAQQAAVTAHGNLLILAGPGSGKTRVLSARGCHLLRSAGPNDQLAAVSFTRDSAAELAGRIGDDSRLISGTFHALAKRQMLDADGALPGVSRGRKKRHLKLLDDAGRAHYVRRAIAAVGVDMTQAEALMAIDTFKSTMIPPPTVGVEAEVFQVYQEALTRHGLLDFADLMINAVRAMQDGTVQPLPVRWLLIDEAQDMDDVQYAWIKAHVDRNVMTTLVADDDQSIYGWRHALGFGGLSRFERDSGAARLTLNGNYRSGRQIVTSALQVIGHNTERFSKTIQPRRESNGAIEFRSFTTAQDEADTVASIVKDDPSGWGLLARTNRRLDMVELSCAALCVPCYRLGGSSFWDQAAPSALLSFLDDLCHGELHGAGVSRIAQFIAGVTPQELDHLHEDGVAMKANPKTTSKGVLELVRFAPEWSGMASTGRTDLMLYALGRWLHAALDSRPGFQTGAALRYIERMTGSITGRINLIRQQARQARTRDVGHQAVLASIHASKGLEWPRVWMLGCEDGVIPHIDSPIAEERRLFYVGMTRAKDSLMLSHTLSGTVASRFFSELPTA